MVELAIATHTMPSAWALESDEAIATALVVLQELAERAEQAAGG
jgi:hypothetical protein